MAISKKENQTSIEKNSVSAIQEDKSGKKSEIKSEKSEKKSEGISDAKSENLGKNLGNISDENLAKHGNSDKSEQKENSKEKSLPKETSKTEKWRIKKANNTIKKLNSLGKRELTSPDPIINIEESMKKRKIKKNESTDESENKSNKTEKEQATGKV